MTRTGNDGDQIEVRIARPTDAAAIAAIYRPVVRDTAISFEEQPPDTAEIAERIRQTGECLPWLVAFGATRRDVLGYALATPYRARAAYRWSVEVTVYVDEPVRGRGVGQSLYRRLHALLREQRFRVTYAVITLPNPASIKLHEALGYQRIGVFRGAGYKLGTWHDVLWMRREIAPLVEQPSEPIPLAELGQATVDAALG